MTKTEPWYIHAALYFVIAVLTFILIKVAIIDPKATVKAEKYNRTESRLRMENLKEAQILYHQQHGHFAGSLDTLVDFVKTSTFVDSIRNAFDSLSRRPADPFLKLTHGEFTPESLIYSPKTHQRYVLQIDTNEVVDSVVNARGRLLRVDTTIEIGTNYYIEDPDGYGTVGSVTDEALRNTVSWE